MEIQLEELVIAYRKAKADSFWEKGHLTATLFSEYEDDLHENLLTLQEALNGNDLSFFKKPNFLGGYTFIPKKLKLSYPDDKEKKIYRSRTTSAYKNERIKLEPEFRLIGDKHSVHFHVLSSLWIEKVGLQYDSKLSSSSYGCRLRTIKQANPKTINDVPIENRHLLSHFQNYLPAYKKWQENAFNTIAYALSQKQEVAVLTTDAEKYYHSINPSVFKQASFWKQIDNETGLNEEQKELTDLLISAFEAWGNIVKKTADRETLIDYLLGRDKRKEWESLKTGLPIGIGASKVLANLYLHFFDKEIEENVQPLYYGRYVDDIILVTSDRGTINNREAFWSLFSSNIDALESNDEGVHHYKKRFGNHWLNIIFPERKERIFLLEGSDGNSFIKAVKKSISKLSSEWRMLPDPETDIDDLSTKISTNSQDGEDAVSGLAKADKTRIKRGAFAIELNKIERLSDLLPEEILTRYRKKFLQVSRHALFSPEGLFTFYGYYPRVFALAVKTRDKKLLKEILKLIQQSLKVLSDLPSFRHEMQLCLVHFKRNITEGLERGIDPTDDETFSFIHNQIGKELAEFLGVESADLRETNGAMLWQDLHFKPLKSWIIFNRHRKLLIGKSFSTYATTIDDALLDKIELEEQLMLFHNSLLEEGYLNNSVGAAPLKAFGTFFFLTRPFNSLDLSFLFDISEEKWREFLASEWRWLFYPHIPIEPPVVNQVESINDYAKIEFGGEYEKPHIALTSFKTKEASWIADVQERSEPDSRREVRLSKLINQILKARNKHSPIEYIVLPELSIPLNRLYYFARELQMHRISLIGGTSYFHHERGLHPNPRKAQGAVSNQVQYVISYKKSGIWNQLLFHQDKTEPATHEESELLRVGGKILKRGLNKFIIEKNGFMFSSLICNEVLNVDYKSNLRGKIDALLIPAWNQDLNTYESTVESTANDLHCFVLLINNRLYGDTRARAPYKKSHLRDIARVRGGELDYFIVVSLDIQALRNFQHNHRSPSEPFKPVPTGFVMDPSRKLK